MLLVTIDEVSEKQLHSLKKIVGDNEVKLETSLESSKLPLRDTEIWITYGFDVTAENLDRMPDLKWIQVFQSGVEHIPFEELEKRDIKLTNVKGIHGVPMAEHVMSIVLYVTRDIPRFIRDQKQHVWNRNELVGEVNGKTMAIFGAGTIGTEVAKKAKSFDMRVIGVNTSGDRHEPFDEMATLADKKRVLAESDFVVLLLPVTDETYHCISTEELKAMKRDSYLINVGRGALVDTDALIDGLSRKTIKGAALDVFEEDPLPKDHPLWDMENVFITPHLSAKTVRYLDRCIEKFKVNLRSYQNGERMTYQVDVEKGY
ncbi:MAG TPA: D-2-hydroxyacid dehydrogenase [Bacillales bacterium]|nr:D-2-hydroxyacid dehydrogenase [Bacillales bacterium]